MHDPKRILLTVFVALLLAAAVSGQRIGVISPDNQSQSIDIAERISTALSTRVKVVDLELARTAFDSVETPSAFNMTAEESKIAGAAIGCDYLLILRSETLNRFSLEKRGYFESYAAFWLISARTGRLVGFELVTFNGFNRADPLRLLEESAPATAATLFKHIAADAKSDPVPIATRAMEVPSSDSPEAARFRIPMSYRRVSPKYTQSANFYSIAATVDIDVELDVKGTIVRTEIVRWAGFGLDESVEEAVRAMNWRAAERDSKPVPVKFVLRYNFKKVEKDE